MGEDLYYLFILLRISDHLLSYLLGLFGPDPRDEIFTDTRQLIVLLLLNLISRCLLLLYHLSHVRLDRLLHLKFRGGIRSKILHYLG